MRWVGLPLLAMVLIASTAGCGGEDETHFNLNGTWLVRSTTLRTDCSLRSEVSHELIVVQRGTYLDFGGYFGHFDTEIGTFSASGTAGGLNYNPSNWVHAEVVGNMTGGESFRASETWTGACNALFEMNGELLHR